MSVTKIRTTEITSIDELYDALVEFEPAKLDSQDPLVWDAAKLEEDRINRAARLLNAEYLVNQFIDWNQGGRSVMPPRPVAKEVSNG